MEMHENDPTRMPTLTKEEINKAEYLSVPSEYSDQVIDCIVDSYDIDDLTNYVKASLKMEFIKSKRAFRRACHSYEEIWGEGE